MPPQLKKRPQKKNDRTDQLREAIQDQLIGPSKRIQTVPLAGGLKGIVVKSSSSAPYLVAASATGKDLEHVRSAAFQYARSTSTIGLVAVHNAERTTLEVYRRRFNKDGFEIAVNAADNLSTNSYVRAG